MANPPAPPPTPAWTGTRVARPARDLARSIAYYRDLLGLPLLGGFTDHDGYDGIFLALPGGGELEFTTGPVAPVAGTDEDLLVLYVDTAEQVRAVTAGLVAAGVPTVVSPNPYWNRHGQTFLDPDGYRIVIAAAPSERGTPTDAIGPRERIVIDWHTGPHAELRALFALAEDSPTQLDRYLENGRVLVARRGRGVLGHLQLVPTTRPGEIELKNMAVTPAHQRTGIGRALVAAAMSRCAGEGWSRMLVATAAADIGNLRFYQRVGFRLLAVERDAFTADGGYPDPIDIDGIPLRDRVWALARYFRRCSGYSGHDGVNKHANQTTESTTMRPLAPVLPGQETLLASWSALARISPGARLIRSSATAVAVFPSWVPLNNAIVLNALDGAAADAVTGLRSVYAAAGVEGWALWLPSRATDLDAPDEVREVGGLKRDTTTLVMQAVLRDGRRRHDGVVRTSIAAATRATDEPVPATELGEPEAVPGLAAWVLVHDNVAVAGAWSFLHEMDCGIYAVGTAPGWRRRGFARSLMEHVLAEAQQRGARTATLQSTRMGQPHYESLGFEAAGRYEEWVPR